MQIQSDSNMVALSDDVNYLKYNKFDTIFNGLKYGIDLIWREPDTECPNSLFLPVAENILMLKKPLRIKTREGVGVFITPILTNNTSPCLLPQSIETDWWPRQIYLYFLAKECVFKKDEPFGKLLIIPKQSYNIKDMSPDIIAELVSKDDYIEENQFYTRMEDTGFVTTDNTYNVLKYKNERNDLPDTLKTKRKTKLRYKLHDVSEDKISIQKD